MRKTASHIFIEKFNESLDMDYPTYDANTYYNLLIRFGVPLEFNNQGLISASSIKNWANSKTTFKQYKRYSWGKNAIEAFSSFKDQKCVTFIEERKEFWLSAFMAWNYAIFSSPRLNIEYMESTWEMFSDMAKQYNETVDDLKELKDQGYNLENVVSINSNNFKDL